MSTAKQAEQGQLDPIIRYSSSQIRKLKHSSVNAQEVLEQIGELLSNLSIGTNKNWKKNLKPKTSPPRTAPSSPTKRMPKSFLHDDRWLQPAGMNTFLRLDELDIDINLHSFYV